MIYTNLDSSPTNSYFCIRNSWCVWGLPL